MKKLFKFLNVLCLIVVTASTAYADHAARNVEQQDQPIKHLTLDEITVTDEAVSEPAVSIVGERTIEKGKNTTIPDVLKNEPEIEEVSGRRYK